MVSYFNCGKGFQANFEDGLSDSKSFHFQNLLEEDVTYVTNLSNEDLLTLVNKTKNNQINYYTGVDYSKEFVFEYAQVKQKEQFILLAFLEDSSCLPQEVNLILNNTIISNDVFFDGILESNKGCWGSFFVNLNEAIFSKTTSLDPLLMFNLKLDGLRFVVENLNEATNLYLVPIASLETNTTPISTSTPVPTLTPTPNSIPTISSTPTHTPIPVPTSTASPCDQIQFSHYQLFDRFSQKFGSSVSQNEILELDKVNNFEIHIVFKDNNLIKSVRVFIDSIEHTENSAPWQAKIFDLSEGKHTIKTIPYLDFNAQGTACVSQNLNFEIKFKTTDAPENPIPTEPISSDPVYSTKLPAIPSKCFGKKWKLAAFDNDGWIGNPIDGKGDAPKRFSRVKAPDN